MPPPNNDNNPPPWLSITGQPLDLTLPHGLLGNCRSINDYHLHEHLGEGTYGVVYRATDTTTQKVYAVKQMRLSARERSNGMPITSIREIALLRSLRHVNVVGIVDVAVGEGGRGGSGEDGQGWGGKGRRRGGGGGGGGRWGDDEDDREGGGFGDGDAEDEDMDGESGEGWETGGMGDVWMVMEYAEQDMAHLLDELRVDFSLSEVKCLMKQLMEGVDYIHKQDIIHRDIKMSNLLYTHNGVLKLADFGMARPYTPRPLTPDVVTIWYRPPELLLGTTRYTPTCDIWSCGLILGELLLLTPLLPGNSDVEQLALISAFLGPPPEELWAGWRGLPRARLAGWGGGGGPGSGASGSGSGSGGRRNRTLQERFRAESRETVKLLEGMIAWDPQRRWSARRVLEARWFTREDPRPKEVRNMPTFPEVRRRSAAAAAGGGGGGGAGEGDMVRYNANQQQQPPPYAPAPLRGGASGPPAAGDRRMAEGGGTAAALAAAVVARKYGASTGTVPGIVGAGGSVGGGGAGAGVGTAPFGSGAAAGFVFDFDFRDAAMGGGGVGSGSGSGRDGGGGAGGGGRDGGREGGKSKHKKLKY